MQKDLKLDVNGIQLNVSDSQSGETPLVFIHPFPFDKSLWDPQVAAFSATHRVIAFDIRGFGKSTMDNKKSSIGLFADDLIQLLDLLKLDKVVACGLSMGGYILLDAVERYPARFKAIILADTQCLADSKDQQQIRYDTIKTIEEKGLNDFTEKFIKKALSPDNYQAKPELVEQLTGTILANSRDAVGSGLSAMAQRSETCSGLKNIQLPCLVISGKDDTVIQPSQSEFLVGSIKGAQLKIIEQAGHLSNIEQPEKFNEIVGNFIKEIN